MDARTALRQQFIASVSALDKAFFLSPAGPGYVGTPSGSSGSLSSRKRAFTLGSADGDSDPQKHRRTVSEAFSEASSLFSAVSPRSNGPASQPPVRPVLFGHTHSSPLLPVESHYRPGSAGSEPIPSPKAADLAASGSHLVGRLNAPSPLKTVQSSEHDMMAESATFVVSEPHLPDISPARTPIAVEPPPLAQAGILAPVPQSATLALPSTSAASIPALQASPMQQSVAHMDMQAYAQQALDNQQLQLAQQQAAIDAAIAVSHPLAMSTSSTPVPYAQHTLDSQQQPMTGVQPSFVSPPPQSIPQFQSTSVYPEVDMGMSHPDTFIPAMPIPPAPAPTPVTGVPGMVPLGMRGPGSLDFTTLRSVKEEGDGMTSPFASSHASLSSYPFTTGTSVTSGSRSRATSVSKCTPASRSRAQSATSGTHPQFQPDAHELESMLGSLTTLPSPIHEDDDDENDHDYFDTSFVSQPQPSETSTSIAKKEKDAISPELLKAYNEVFYKWLPLVCADVEFTDRKNEKVHQPLMAKKMQRLDEEHAFRPFKFRIQPFTNAFQDACRDAGLTEQDVAPKLVSSRQDSFSMGRLTAL